MKTRVSPNYLVNDCGNSFPQSVSKIPSAKIVYSMPGLYYINIDIAKW